MRVVPSAELTSVFEPGDLLVVNDAATLPASLFAKTDRGADVELRLVTAIGDTQWTVALLGRGDYRTRTEDRLPPPPVLRGDRLFIGGVRALPRSDVGLRSTRVEGLVATVMRTHAKSSRLADIELAIERSSTEESDSLEGDPASSVGEIWAALYRLGRPVQYAHVPEPLALWDVQNVYAGRPWAVEMPSAGRVLRVETLLELRSRGVEIARVTHAAGLSSIGDAAIDAMLPLPERFEVTEETWEEIARARSRRGRVVAIGTSAARALEGGVRAGVRSGITEFRIGPETRRAIVDAVLTGVHDTDTSHYALLGAFAKPDVLARALARAEREGMLGHELGDACLVWGEPRRDAAPAHPSGTGVEDVL